MTTGTVSELAYLSRALKAPRIRDVASRLAEEVSAGDGHGSESRVKAARFLAVK